MITVLYDEEAIPYRERFLNYMFHAYGDSERNPDGYLRNFYEFADEDIGTSEIVFKLGNEVIAAMRLTEGLSIHWGVIATHDWCIIKPGHEGNIKLLKAMNECAHRFCINRNIKYFQRVKHISRTVTQTITKEVHNGRL